MADLEPGTPEYQEAYDAELKRLDEAGDTPITSEAATAEPAAVTADPAEESPQPSVEDQIRELRESNERLEKQARDNQSWATKNAQELARIKKERDEQIRQQNRPKILDDVPGLEEAIRHTATPTAAAPPPEQAWGDTVVKALPDIDGLLADPGFFQKASEVRQKLGQDWNDPLIAIRELSNARAEHMRATAVSKAVEQAQRDHAAKAKKLGAMAVPGGSGKPGAAKTEQEEVERINTMSDEDFAKMVRKAKGY